MFTQVGKFYPKSNWLGFVAFQKKLDRRGSNHSINYVAVCRTTLATPGLSIKLSQFESEIIDLFYFLTKPAQIRVIG